MGAPVAGVDAVGEREGVLVKRLVVLERDLNQDLVGVSIRVHHAIVNRHAPSVQRSYHAFHAAVEVVVHLIERPQLLVPVTVERDSQRAVQVRHLAEPGSDRVEVV